MGMRLKIASNKFNWTIIRSIKYEVLSIMFEEFGISFKIKLATIAIATLVSGPAKETKARSFLPSRKLKGSTGTGLAPPIITGEPEIRRRRAKQYSWSDQYVFSGQESVVPLSGLSVAETFRNIAMSNFVQNGWENQNDKCDDRACDDRAKIFILFKNSQYDIIFTYVQRNEMWKLRKRRDVRAQHVSCQKQNKQSFCPQSSSCKSSDEWRNAEGQTLHEMSQNVEKVNQKSLNPKAQPTATA